MRVLVIADQHAPFMHRAYVPFLLNVQSEFHLDTVVNIGDVADQYFASRFQKDPSHLSASWEIEQAQKQIAQLNEAFPDQLVCIGNHDERVAKRSQEAGVPGEFIKNYAAVWGTPFWYWKTSHKLDGVLYTHGTGWSGVTAPRRAALEYGQNVVMGHAHKFAGIQWINQKGKRKQLWGMNVGWGGDEKAYAFAYGKDSALGGVLGCGVVIHGQPQFIAMR